MAKKATKKESVKRIVKKSVKKATKKPVKSKIARKLFNKNVKKTAKKKAVKRTYSAKSVKKNAQAKKSIKKLSKKISKEDLVPYPPRPKPPIISKRTAKIGLGDTKKHNVSKLELVNEKLDKLLREHEILIGEQKKLENKESSIEFLEKKELKEEEKIQELEQKEFDEVSKLSDLEEKEIHQLKKLEELEKNIQKDVGEHPLAKITIKDFFKATVGAFIGIVFHYTFIYGLKIAQHLTIIRASFLYLFSLLIGGIIIYTTGFRKITELKLLIFWPLRLFIVYLTALLVCIMVLYFFEPHFGVSFAESYIKTSAVMVPAIIGAAGADLLGRD